MSVEIEATSGFPRPRAASKPRRFDKSLVDRKGIWDSRELVEIGHCVFCASRDYREVVIRQDGLPIQECAACGLAFVDPRPSPQQLKKYYGRGYFSGEKDFFHGKDYCLERDKAIESGVVTGYREITSNFELKGKTILDIGCASGALLSALKIHSPKELVGVDTAEYPVSFGRERYGLDLHCATLDEANLPAEHFDLVTLIDVIEHVEDLNSFLLQLQRVLAPGGSVFIITPNYAAYFLARQQWTCLYKDFEHLQYFSATSIKDLCATTGLSVMKSWTDSLPYRVFEYPRLYKKHLHIWLHPRVAAKNGLAQRKYSRASMNNPSVGANLNLVLAAAG